MRANMVVYKGKINKERNGAIPLRGQGLEQSRSVKINGGRQLLVKHNLKTGTPVEFMFPKVTDKSTKYNYAGDLIFR